MGPARSRILTHGDSQFHLDAGIRLWSCAYLLPLRFPARGLIVSSQLIPTNRIGLAVAQWRIERYSAELILDIFQETPVDSGLLEGIVLSVVLLRSGRSLGDSLERLDLSNPIYLASLGVGVGFHR